MCKWECEAKEISEFRIREIHGIDVSNENALLLKYYSRAAARLGGHLNCLFDKIASILL